MAFHTTRRESLELLGVGLTALTGCGGTDNPGGGGGGKGGLAGDAGSGGKGGNTFVEGGAPGSAGVGGSSTAGVSGQGAVAGEGGVGGNAPACVAKNEATAGPYPNLSPLNRRDVRSNTTDETTPKDGAELVLRIKVMDLAALCGPIEGAVVDIWQCDALGVYASYEPFATAGQDFLRGYQKTNAQGIAEFLTIFPGAYSGRAIHIHFSIRASAGVLAPNASGSGMPDVFIAQLYFEDADSHAIFAAHPIYQGGSAITPNGLDGIFSAGGHDLLVSLSETLTGYAGDVTIGVSRASIGM
jgi:protocatechuate 3,4-dioxygenase beta subunit